MWIYLKNNWVLFILKMSGSHGSLCILLVFSVLTFMYTVKVCLLLRNIYRHFFINISLISTYINHVCCQMLAYISVRQHKYYSWKTLVSGTQTASCDKQIQLEKPLCSFPTRMLHIILRRVEEIFPGVKERLVSICAETILTSL
jgi:hypothetical protein